MTNSNFFEKAPSHWTRTRLKFLVREDVPAKKEEILESADEASFLPMDAIGEDGSLDLSETRPVEEIANRYTQFFEGEVLLAKITPCFENGKSAVARGLADGVGYGTTELFVLRPRESILPEYLYYLIRTPDFRQQGEAAMTGAAGQKRVPTEFVQNYRVAVPPIEEQREILDALNEEFDQLRRLVEAKRDLIDWLNEKRRSLIARAVTRGLDDVPMNDSGYGWLGEVPAHWNIERLKFHLHGIEQGWSPSCYSYPAPEDKWGVLKVGAVNDWIFDPSENKQLPKDTEPRPELEIEEGDVLMSRANTIELLGSVSIVQSTRDKLLLCDKLYRLDLKDDRFHPEFLVRFLRSDPGRFEFEQSATGTSGSMQNITQETVQNVWVLRPPLDEQRDIVEFINERTGQINRVREGTQHTIDLLEERRRSLITAAVTGKLDVGVPA